LFGKIPRQRIRIQIHRLKIPRIQIHRFKIIRTQIRLIGPKKKQRRLLRRLQERNLWLKACQLSTAVSAKGAYDLLLVEAKKWKEDAVLVNLKSDQDVALDGKSSTWEAHFISKGDLKKGWKATMKDKIVSDAAEEETNAKNIVEPPFTVDSGDAIKAGLGDLGATEVTVSSIRLFQETESGEWFWSIATDKGNITLKSR